MTALITAHAQFIADKCWAASLRIYKGSWPYVGLLFWSGVDQIPALSYIHHTLADQVHALIKWSLKVHFRRQLSQNVRLLNLYWFRALIT